MTRNDVFNRFSAAILIVAGAIAFSVYRTVDFSEDTPKNTQPATSATVKRVVSANKIKTGKGQELILAGIRAPHPNEPYGSEATELLRSMIEGKRVRLRFGEVKKDKKDRWVGYVFIDSEMANERLVHDGLAYVRLKNGQLRFRDQLLAAQRDAMAAGRGLWKSRRLDNKGEYIGDRKHGTYHLPSCADVPNIKPGDDVHLRGTGAAFEQGFAPCSHCDS